MASTERRDGLLVGPSVEDIVSGVDISAFGMRLDDEGARSLFDYWCRLVRAHGVAMKHAFDVTEIPRVLATIYMEEYDTERRQSRMRLMGETLKAQWHRSVVGLCTDEYVTGDTNRLWKEADRLVYLEQRAVILTYDLEYIDRPHCTLVDLSLPMDDKDGNSFAIGCAWQAS